MCPSSGCAPRWKLKAIRQPAPRGRSASEEIPPAEQHRGGVVERVAVRAAIELGGCTARPPGTRQSTERSMKSSPSPDRSQMLERASRPAEVEPFGEVPVNRVHVHETERHPRIERRRIAQPARIECLHARRVAGRCRPRSQVLEARRRDRGVGRQDRDASGREHYGERLATDPEPEPAQPGAIIPWPTSA